MIANIPTGAWIVLLGAGVSWYSTLGYALLTMRGKLRPSLASWGVWTATAALGTGAAFVAGSTVGVVISAATCLCCAQVFVAALYAVVRDYRRARRGEPPLVEAEPHTLAQRVLDMSCLTACGGIGIVWWLTDDAWLAFLLSIVVDGIACLPTIWHGLQGQEHPKPFVLGMVGPVIALLCVQERVFVDYGWPLYGLGVNILMLIPALVVGWPAADDPLRRVRLPAWQRLAAPAGLAVLYAAALALVYAVIPPPGGSFSWPSVTWAAVLTLAAAVITAVAILPAAWAAANGRIWISPVTWVAWALLGVVALAWQIEIGGTAQIVLCTVLGGLAILMAYIAVWAAVTRRAPPAEPDDGVSWQHYVDAVCSVGAAGAFLALLTSGPDLTIGLTIATDAIAAIPTVTVAWRNPHAQPLGMFFGVALASGLIILSIGRPAQWIDIAYMVYLFLLDITVTAIIVGREMWLNRSRPDPAAPPPLAPPWLTPELPPYQAFLRATAATRHPIDRPQFLELEEADRR